MDLLSILGLTPGAIQNQIADQQMQQPQAQPVALTMDNNPNVDNTGDDYFTQLQNARGQTGGVSLPIPSSYQPTSGSQMEADSRSSVDDLMSKLAGLRDQYRQQDANQQWMNFFGKLASSKSNTLLGGLGEGANALAETAAKQQANNQLLDQAALAEQIKYQEWLREQARQEQAVNQTGAYQQGELGLKAQELALGHYQPVKDVFGNVTGIFDARTGKMVPTSAISGVSDTSSIDMEPSSDPQKAAQQILAEQGTPLVPVASRQDITGRNQQAKAYNDQALAAKNVIQQLDVLDSQTGKYTPGKVAGMGYGAESAIGMGGEGASARTEADKAAVQLANAFMQANTAANRSGIGVLNFDAKGVPNPDMTDEARSALIDKQKAVANSQIQRNEISSLYPRLHIANVNAIMNDYESKNPPLLPSGMANPQWMPYKDWLTAGRPNTTMPLQGNASSSSAITSSGSTTIPPIPASLPTGSQYSPSLKQWRDSSGKLYDAFGNPL